MTTDIQANQAEALVDMLTTLGHAVAAVENLVDGAEHLEPVAHASAIAVVQDMRHRLGQVEAELAIALGKREGTIQGNLPDGRQFTLKRAQDRKAWDHDEWKRDARRAIVNDVLNRAMVYDDDQEQFAEPDLYDPQTGEQVTLGRVLHEAVAIAQQVHGATPPKSTALKALGLYASDYCESSPGGWRFNAIRPEPPKPTDTTTEKD